MKLLTHRLRQIIPGQRAQEHVDDPIAYAKFFDPTSQWTWYVTEGWQRYSRLAGHTVTDLGDGDLPLSHVHEKGDIAWPGDITFFGLVIGFEVELGYFTLRELESWRGRLGLPLERDLYFEPTPLSVIREAAEAAHV